MAERQDRRPAGPRIVIPETVSEFYANSVTIAASLWDFTLFFGSNELTLERVNEVAPFSGTVRIDAVIRLSPQQAKAMLVALTNTVQQYEQQVGTIGLSGTESEHADNPRVE